jgi:hypothetical protein
MLDVNVGFACGSVNYRSAPQKNTSLHTSGFNGSHVEKPAAPVASEKAGKEEVKVLIILNLRPGKDGGNLK